MTSNPACPFSVVAGQCVSVLFGAASNASTGQYKLTAQATSGTLSHSQDLALAVRAVAPTNLSRSGYVENDSVAAVDSPPGEPHRRHIVFDSANQRFYVANLAMNRVEVFSAASPALQSTITAPGASSVDLSADGNTVWVGTRLEQILAIDTSVLQVKARYPVSGITPIPGVVYIRPAEAVALSSGKLLVRLRQWRQRLFLTATDHVDVFDVNAMGFLSAIEPPPNGPPPDAGLRGLALTPDFSQLIVADFGAQSVYLINPDGAAYNGTAASPCVAAASRRESRPR